MYAVIMGHLGEDIVAANSIVSMMRNLASVLGFGIANGTAIILGKTIGAGDMARAGGDSRFGFFCDFIAMWAVFVPLGFIAAFVWNLPPLWVYLILSCDEFAKMPFVYIRYRQKKWLRNITKEVTA